jgi:hypothetical protein
VLIGERRDEPRRTLHHCGNELFGIGTRQVEGRPDHGPCRGDEAEYRGWAGAGLYERRNAGLFKNMARRVVQSHFRHDAP